VRNAQTDFQLETKPACVLADGPQETDGDGGYEYTVCFGDEDGESICENQKCLWHLWDFEAVGKFVQELCDKYGLENVNETSMP
jgi:hypothetical protein